MGVGASHRRSGLLAFARPLADTDDFLLPSASLVLLDRLITMLRDEWQVEEKQPFHKHMGLAVHRSAAKIRISATKHIDQLLGTIDLRDCNPAKLPHDPHAD